MEPDLDTRRSFSNFRSQDWNTMWSSAVTSMLNTDVTNASWSSCQLRAVHSPLTGFINKARFHPQSRRSLHGCCYSTLIFLAFKKQDSLFQLTRTAKNVPWKKQTKSQQVVLLGVITQLWISSILNKLCIIHAYVLKGNIPKINRNINLLIR